MPSHIFLQLGMWPEAAASNEAAWKASQEWVQRKGLPSSQLDYHSLHWLLYVNLQQGRYRDAEERLTTMRRLLAEFGGDDPLMRIYATYTHASMAAAFVVETQRWDAAEELLPSSPRKAAASRASSGTNPYRAFAALAQAPVVFARGLAAAMNGAPAAQESIAALRAIRQTIAPPGMEGSSEESMGAVLQIQEAAAIQELEIAAAVSAARKRWDEAIRTMRKATAREEATPPPPGPPPLIKPSHELFGEILLQASRPEEAGQQFARSLYRHPDRARSLLGTARAAARGEDQETAVEMYTKLLRQWQTGDAPLPEREEAREYMKRAGARSP
jgi:tetratricopeptide (TPR) repeat protein